MRARSGRLHVKFGLIAIADLTAGEVKGDDGTAKAAGERQIVRKPPPLHDIVDAVHRILGVDHRCRRAGVEVEVWVEADGEPRIKTIDEGLRGCFEASELLLHGGQV